MDDGSVFEIGKYYKHSSGQKMAIRGRLDTYFHGGCLVGEDGDSSLLPVGSDTASTVNWYEISEKEWDAPRDYVADVIPAILEPTTSYRTRAEHLLSLLIQLGASDAATEMVQSLSEAYGYDSLYGKRESGPQKAVSASSDPAFVPPEPEFD